jgi:hypothetical protein
MDHRSVRSRFGNLAVRRLAILVTICDGHESSSWLPADPHDRQQLGYAPERKRDQALHRLQGGHGPPRSDRVRPICISDLLTFSYQSLAKSY